MKLVIAEKPSVAQDLARVLGACQRKDGYCEGKKYLVSWCYGHLAGFLKEPIFWSVTSTLCIPRFWAASCLTVIFP